MEGFWFCYGANYGNCEDNFGCIIREFSNIILLFFNFYEAHILNLQGAASLVKCNVGRERSEELMTDTDFANAKIIGTSLRLCQRN